MSLPPGAVAARVVEAVRADARRLLAPVIAEVVSGVAEPFVQAVFDIEVPRMVHGRVCLIGDAAFAVRPHAAAGTAKAAADAWELAAQLAAHRGDLDAALAGVGAAPARARAGAAASATARSATRRSGTGTFRPGRPGADLRAARTRALNTSGVSR